MCNIWAVYKYRQYWLPFMSAVENHYFGALHSARKHCQPKRIFQMPKTIDTVAFDGKIAYFLTWLVGIIFCPVNSNAGYNLKIRETKNMTPFDANSEHSIRRIKLYEDRDIWDQNTGIFLVTWHRIHLSSLKTPKTQQPIKLKPAFLSI